jgi:hypothetical protein
MKTKIARHAAVVLALILFGSATSSAQGGAGREGMSGMAAGGNRMLVPAQWVLSHKDDLKLTADQSKQFAALALAQTDSQKARMQRIERSGTVARGAAMGKTLQDWEGPVDEKGIRALSREQADFQADMMLGLIRDRRAVGKLLTAAQRAQLPALEQKDMMAMMGH